MKQVCADGEGRKIEKTQSAGAREGDPGQERDRHTSTHREKETRDSMISAFGRRLREKETRDILGRGGTSA